MEWLHIRVNIDPHLRSESKKWKHAINPADVINKETEDECAKLNEQLRKELVGK